jgi:hypothetical protein
MGTWYTSPVEQLVDLSNPRGQGAFRRRREERFLETAALVIPPFDPAVCRARNDAAIRAPLVAGRAAYPGSTVPECGRRWWTRMFGPQPGPGTSQSFDLPRAQGPLGVGPARVDRHRCDAVQGHYLILTWPCITTMNVVNCV